MGNEIKIRKIDPSQIRYTPQEGEIVQNPEGKYLIWKDNQWNIINMESSGIDLSLYDMNKQIIAQLPDLTDWDRVEALLNDFYNLHHNTYYMMYGKEIS